MTLRFERFGWRGLESEAAREDRTVDDTLARAIARYESMLPANSLTLKAPRFKARDKGTAREISLELGSDCWKHLEEEATRQGIPLEELLQHAALVYLADNDSGR